MMTPRRCLTAAACALACATVTAETPTERSALLEGEQLRERIDSLAERDLKALYLRCSRDASERSLGFEEAARCSIASEVLKHRFFAGDFDALLAWWRLHRDDPLAAPADPAGRRRSVPASRTSGT